MVVGLLVGLDEQTEHIRRNYYSSGGKTNNITIAQEVTVEKAGILFLNLRNRRNGLQMLPSVFRTK